MAVKVETEAADPALYAGSLLDSPKLKGRIGHVALGSLPNDGEVIEDLRHYD